jgi:hypothetical protein
MPSGRKPGLAPIDRRALAGGVTVYYRDDAVQVTSESVRAGGHAVPIAELTYVWHARGRTTVREGSHLVGRGVLVFLLSIPPLVAVVCVVALAYSAQDRGNWKLAVTIVAACAAGALALTPFLEFPLRWLDRSYDRGASVHELWVQRRGQEIMLLRTSDGLRFGQIYRALQRAVEQHGS